MFRKGVLALAAIGFVALLVAIELPGRAPGALSIDVVFIVATDCPISNRYAPEIARICSDYKARGVKCSLAYVDRDVTTSQIKQHQVDFKLSGIPAVIDSNYAITDAAGARVTPEAAVFSNGRRVYHGRIDDLNPELGRTKREATRHDVRLALDQIIANQPVAMPEAHAVGCFIERVKVK